MAKEVASLDDSIIEEAEIVEKPKRGGFVGFLIDNWFMLSTIAGVIIGFGVGFAIQQAGLDETGKIWIGEFFPSCFIPLWNTKMLRLYLIVCYRHARYYLHSALEAYNSSHDCIKHY